MEAGPDHDAFHEWERQRAWNGRISHAAITSLSLAREDESQNRAGYECASEGGQVVHSCKSGSGNGSSAGEARVADRCGPAGSTAPSDAGYSSRPRTLRVLGGKV